MRVSAGLPTGMEGLTYPIPFSDPENVIRIAQAAEKFGYDSVWGNDHMTTQNYVRAEFPVPPRFWEPLIAYAFVLSETKTIKVGTGVIVLPMRHDIVVLAKQIATLDHFGKGRVEIGLGNPRKRPAAVVAEDVRQGFISSEAARRDYGVAVNDDGTVDEAETAKLRAIAAE